MNRKQIHFIINPISGNGKKLNWQELIDQHLDHSQFDYTIHFTQSQYDATFLSKKAAQSEVDIVCAVGGDGTINEVAKGLLHSNTALSIIPRGSGNGLARHLNIPLKPEEAIIFINHGTISKMDVGYLNDQLFLCVAGMGFDAQVAHAFNRFGKRGFLSYAWLSIISYLKYKPIVCQIHVDRKTLNLKAFLISFANASQFGNDTYIAPHAKINDGFLNLVSIKPFPFWSIPQLIFKTFQKKIHTSRYYEAIQFQSLSLETSSTISHIDGEPIFSPPVVRVTVEPKALNILY